MSDVKGVFVPPVQLAAEALAGLIISAGQKGNAANIVKRANTALEVGAALTALGNGDPTTGFNALNAALANSSLDPGIVLAFQGALSFGQQQVALAVNLNAFIPGLGATLDEVALNLGAAATTVGNAEIAKYAPQLGQQKAAAEPAAQPA